MQLAEQLSAVPVESQEDFTVSKNAIEIARRRGLYALGESFIRGEWETSDLFEFMYRLVTADPQIQVNFRKFDPRFIVSILKDRLFNLQVGKRAFEVGEKHYDLGNDLFSKMLDKSSMSYTCGYWRNATNLEDAQIQKVDILCRKLKLSPGMRVLDIGCGWGNFAYHAASKYGVKVVGLTVSKEQAAFARQRCKAYPVEILLQDYQTFSGEFDRVVSIEMIEAVGRKNIPTFFKIVDRCLKPGGLFALQVISAETFSLRSNAALDQFIIWLQRRIFPNGWIPSLPSLMDAARSSLVLEDLDNFSADYARTLNAWANNFEAAWPRLAERYGEPFHRMWLYYLRGCQALFTARAVQLYQIVYSKGGIPGGYHPVR